MEKRQPGDRPHLHARPSNVSQTGHNDQVDVRALKRPAIFRTSLASANRPPATSTVSAPSTGQPPDVLG